ncbi:MAG: pseudouridine synthase [Candidatus Saccharibacteria bacterium]|nr:pseudouridine synthase [Candidatus Saccharibacteria bacterium]
MSQVRLNKFLAERLGVSRREADDLIRDKKITINGRTAVLGDRLEISKDGEFDENYKICYNNKIIPLKTDFIYIALNKPVGYVCSRRAQGGARTLYELLPDKYKKLKTVGRLDKDSSGLILLTNDGDFAYRMTHPKFQKEKIYEVDLDRPLAPLHQQMISDYGIMLEDGVSKFTVIRRIDSPKLITGQNPHELSEKTSETDRRKFTVVLTEGRNRQIRRTFAALGYKVVKLHRIKFSHYTLDDLASGRYQTLPAPID